jgi:predicted PurR-regulated permease PerM
LTGKTKKILIIITASFLVLLLGMFFVMNRNIIWAILKPFIIGVTIAYLFNPLVEAATERGSHRITAVILVYTVVLGFVAGTSYFFLPQVYRETLKLMDILPDYAFKAKDYLDNIYIRFSKALTPELKEAIRDNIDDIQELIINQIKNLSEKFLAFFGGLVNWIIALVISFYLLKDKNYFLNLAEYIIPVSMRQDAARISDEINSVLMRFIRGQLLVSIIVGISATIGFLLIDLNFAVLMGIITGLGNVIPYFGPVFGGIPVAVVGLMESPTKALWAVIIVVIVQQLESGIITPKILGDSVGIHPVFIILSLLIAGQFFGLIGLFFAVPAAAILKIFAVYIFNKIVNTT